jgi:hypothetical protein
VNITRVSHIGFNLNFDRPESLNLLYYVDSLKKKTIYSESLRTKFGNKNRNSKSSHNALNKQNDEDSNESESDVELEALNKSTKSQSDGEFEEKNEILCLQFNQNLNLLATGDSNGTIQVNDATTIL